MRGEWSVGRSKGVMELLLAPPVSPANSACKIERGMIMRSCRADDLRLKACLKSPTYHQTNRAGLPATRLRC